MIGIYLISVLGGIVGGCLVLATQSAILRIGRKRDKRAMMKRKFSFTVSADKKTLEKWFMEAGWKLSWLTPRRARHGTRLSHGEEAHLASFRKYLIDAGVKCGSITGKHR